MSKYWTTTITLETNIINDYQTLDLVVQWQQLMGNVSRFVQIGEAAIDVIYSTKVDNQNIAIVNKELT